MKEVSYIPKLERDSNKVFEGEVTISLPKYKERLQMLKEVNFKYVNGQVESGLDQIDSMVKVVEIAEKHIVSVNLTRIEDQAQFLSIDDLQYDKDGADLINEIGNVILSGMPVGKI